MAWLGARVRRATMVFKQPGSTGSTYRRRSNVMSAIESGHGRYRVSITPPLQGLLARLVTMVQALKVKRRAILRRPRPAMFVTRRIAGQCPHSSTTHRPPEAVRTAITVGVRAEKRRRTSKRAPSATPAMVRPVHGVSSVSIMLWCVVPVRPATTGPRLGESRRATFKAMNDVMPVTRRRAGLYRRSFTTAPR